MVVVAEKRGKGAALRRRALCDALGSSPDLRVCSALGRRCARFASRARMLDLILVDRVLSIGLGPGGPRRRRRGGGE